MALLLASFLRQNHAHVDMRGIGRYVLNYFVCALLGPCITVLAPSELIQINRLLNKNRLTTLHSTTGECT
jgi:hypothetical protein